MNPLPSVLSTEKLLPALNARRPSETDVAPARRLLLGSSAAFLGALSILLWAYWPTIAFLFFMLPLPFRVEVALSHPLQKLASQSSTYVLQTIGLPAFAEGNVISLGKAKINIVEACNGLSMLIIFFALSTGMALL